MQANFGLPYTKFHRENCKNGCIHSQQIEKEEKNSINANDDDEIDSKDDDYNIDNQNVMCKNDGNHGNYDADYLGYVDSNFENRDYHNGSILGMFVKCLY
jgi:aconitase A